MDFGEILKRWEKAQAAGGEEASRPGAPHIDMEEALGRYPPAGQGEEARDRESTARTSPAQEAGFLKALKPQAVLDLHGMSSVEAEEALDRFIRDSRARGLAKVLIIHGKGLHSPGEPVLGQVVRSYLEKCPSTGAFGRASREDGGRGASWVLIRGSGASVRDR
jgi:DNA-nicking Smr family endonuclease